MKFILIFFSFLVSGIVLGQKTYSIYYSQVTEIADFTLQGQKLTNKIEARLIFNDSISFFYFITPNKKDKYKEEKIIGDKLVHHGVVYNRNNNELLSEVAWPKKKYYLIKTEQPVFDWIFTKETKNLLGYKCNQAIWPNSTGDTLFVWYTNEINNVFGPMAYFGLPGVVLEVYGHKKNSLLTVKSIDVVPLTLVQPDKNIPRLSMEEHLRKAMKN
jgi:GLPGLI family protein